MKKRKKQYSNEFKQDAVNYYYSSNAEKEIARLKKELGDKDDASYTKIYIIL